MLLVEDMVLCETTVRVDPSEKHSLADVGITSPTLEAFAAEDVGLAGDNVALAEGGDFLAYFDDFSGELVAHDHWRVEFVSDRFLPVVDVHVRSTDCGCFYPRETVSQPRF